MKKLTKVICYLLSVQLLALLILTLFRCILYFTNMNQVAEIDNKVSLFFQALLKGLQFDSLIASYILILPLFVLTVMALFNKLSKTVIKIFNVYFIVFYTLVFAISAADIPYFKYFFTHLDGSIFNWLRFAGTTGGMVFQESSYYVYMILFLVMSVLFGIFIFKFGKKTYSGQSTDLKKMDYIIAIPIVIVTWGLCFVGSRGGVERYPLRASSAYFSTNSFINQLGINPTFYLMKTTSAFLKKHNNVDGLIDDQEALAFVQNALKSKPTDDVNNPIGRYIKSDSLPLNANVVIILMESMSANYLKFESNGKSLTPYLNKLIGESYYFNNFYSAGIHTNNGIASTLYGYPAQFDKTMMDVNVDKYSGLPYNLKCKGYETMFFVTSNPQYDNMNSFFIENGFDRIYSQYDYPADKVVNNFGVQDDYLFEYGIERLNEASKRDKPFLATFMTVTDHPPYVVPEKYKNVADNDEARIIAFVDDCIKQFMESAKKQDWYQNTIFVFLGDHGRAMGTLYEMPLSYNHIPLIIHSPLLEDMPKQFEQFGGQIDVFPTIMGILNDSYQNNSLGVDLFREQRPCIYFTSNNRLGCIDDKFFYIYNPQDKIDGLYDYRNQNPENIIDKYRTEADSMKQYSVSMMIEANNLLRGDFDR